MPSRRVLLGVSWAETSPVVRVRDNGNLLSKEIPLVGLKLNYRADEHSAQLCLGHVPFRKGRDAYVDCVNRPSPGERKCSRCAINDATFAANLHHAHKLDPDTIDSSVARHMLQPNVAYLAAFRDGSVKIGTSTLKRRDERLTEQGAWLATIVASSTDGFAIRDLEDKITRDLGLPQSVSSRRKLRGLANPAANEVLRCRLTDHANYVGRLIQQLGDDRLSVMNVPWQSHAVADHVWDNVHKYGPSLNLGCHELNIRAASGRRVAFTRSGHGDVFVADLGPLMGTELELGDFDPVSIAVQDALF